MEVQKTGVRGSSRRRVCVGARGSWRSDQRTDRITFFGKGDRTRSAALWVCSGLFLTAVCHDAVATPRHPLFVVVSAPNTPTVLSVPLLPVLEAQGPLRAPPRHSLGAAS